MEYIRCLKMKESYIHQMSSKESNGIVMIVFISWRLAVKLSLLITIEILLVINSPKVHLHTVN